ncbi:DUF5366 family protein [Peribacillus alkalitolerans]|uniref:DUF5366 family protein n=1 Tax=Peribacillus alkalitolerans TaxID=1550385 RepID=UPI0013D46180|nr:DUF5366 family protein [Peribacillus alkalitolerans]
MKNTYLTGYFPLISIILFSLSFAIYGEMEALILLKNIGVYDGMREFFSVTGIKLSLLLAAFICFFMIFAALKLISDTILEFSLLFFSKDSEGDSLKSVRKVSVIYVIGGVLSLLMVKSILFILAAFIITTVVAFVYFVNIISPTLSNAGLIGLIFFHTFIWSILLLTVALSLLKLYNSMIASLPV